MTEKPKATYESASNYLKQAQSTIELAERIFLQFPQSQAEVTTTLLKAWAWISLYHAERDNKSANEALTKTPVKPEVIFDILDAKKLSLPEHLSYEEWKIALKNLYQQSTTLTSSDVDLSSLEQQIDICKETLLSLWQQCFQDFDVRPPYKTIAYIGSTLLLGIIIALTVRSFIRVPGPYYAAYFNNQHLRGTPIDYDDVEEINYDWAYDEPTGGLGITNYSIRYDTCLKLDSEAVVRIALGSDDGSRLFINNEKVIDKWRASPYSIESFQRTLPAGTYHLRTDFFQLQGGAKLTQRIMVANMPLFKSEVARLEYPTSRNGLNVACDSK